MPEAEVSIMAEQGRLLQEYVAQQRTGPTGERSETSRRPQEPGPGWRSWLPAAPSLAPLEPDPLLPGVSASQRLLLCGLCVALAVLCFGLSSLYVPVLLLRARKFALLWSLGSVLGLAAAALLRGPSRMLKEPELWSLLYVATLGGTLYAALGIRSTGLTVLGAAAQVITGVGLLLGMLPGGAAGRRYIGGLCGSLLKKGVSKALPV